MWWSVLVACQEPFGTDRHDLVGFRVAAMSVPPASAGQSVEPRVGLIVDGRPWADRATELGWWWVADPKEAEQLDLDDPEAPPEASGVAPSLVVPEDRRVLALVARSGSEVRRAVLAVAEPPSTLTPPGPISVSGLAVEVATATAEQLAIDARRNEATTGPVDAVAPGDFARLSAAGDEATGGLIRWMATAGTFFELDPRTTDWVAGELRLDGDEIDEDVPRTETEPGWVTFLALAVGAPGQTAFRATDLLVADDPAAVGDGLWVGGRFVPTDASVAWSEGQQVRGTLAADDGSPCGLRLTAATAEPVGEAPALPCAVPTDGSFDPTVLLEQRCTRAELDGATVVILPQAGR